MTTPRAKLPVVEMKGPGRITFQLLSLPKKPDHAFAVVQDRDGCELVRLNALGWEACDMLFELGGVAKLEEDVYDVVLYDVWCRECARARLDLIKCPVGYGGSVEQPQPVKPVTPPPSTLAAKIMAAFAPWTEYKAELCGSKGVGATQLLLEPHPPAGVLIAPIELQVQSGYGCETVSVVSVAGGVVDLSAPLEQPFAAGSQVCFIWTAGNVAQVCEPSDVEK